MKESFGNIGQFGVNKDISVANTQINVWTDALNIRFRHGSACLAHGYSDMYLGVSPTVTPYHVAPVTIDGQFYWFYAGAAKVYLLGDATNSNVTRQTAGADVDYTATQNAWTSCYIGGVPVLNPGNTTDPPQMFSPVDTSTKLSALSNWPASTYCSVMRSYKNYLVALNVTKTATTYPFLVKWSHPAEPGAVPSSWDETDATKDAGEYDIADGQDIIIDGLALGDSFIIYKERSVWRMNYIGGVYVHSFSKIHSLSNIGILAKNCAVDIGGAHLVLTDSDVIVHDGNSYKSVVDSVARNALFENIDSNNYTNCFVFKNPLRMEAYVCYPSGGNTIPNKALVYNYKDSTVSFWDIPSIYHGNDGGVNFSDGEVWSDDTGSWAASTDTWSNPGGVPTISSAVMANASGVYVIGQSNLADSAFISAYLEKQAITFGDDSTVKIIQRIYPKIYGDAGDTVTVSVGYSATPYGTPTYVENMTYTIGTDTYLEPLVSARYLALKFSSSATAFWRLDSLDVEYETLGEFI